MSYGRAEKPCAAYRPWKGQEPLCGNCAWTENEHEKPAMSKGEGPSAREFLESQNCFQDSIDMRVLVSGLMEAYAQDLQRELAEARQRIEFLQGYGERRFDDAKRFHDSLAKIRQTLYAAIDREDDDEDAVAVATIAANAIYWRDQAIEKLQRKLDSFLVSHSQPAPLESLANTEIGKCIEGSRNYWKGRAESAERCLLQMQNAAMELLGQVEQKGNPRGMPAEEKK